MTIAEMGGTSRQAIAAARAALDNSLKGKSDGDIAKFASELFTVLSALDSSAPLRRSLTDVARDTKDKEKLVSDLFARSAANVVPLLSALVNLKWSKPSDLADAIEQLAIESEAAAANLSGELLTRGRVVHVLQSRGWR